MATERIHLEATASVDDYVQALKKAEAATQALADKHGTSVAVARKAQDAYRKAGQSAFDAKKGVDGLRKSAEAIQGPLGSTISRLVGAGEAAASFATALGPAGVALVAVGGAAIVAVGGLAATALAATKLTQAAIGARDRLDKLRQAGQAIGDVTEREALGLDNAKESMTELGIATDRLTEVIGARLAPTIAIGTAALAGSIFATANLISNYHDLLDTLGGSALGGGVIGAFGGLASVLDQVHSGIERLTGLDQLQERQAEAAAFAVRQKVQAHAAEITALNIKKQLQDSEKAAREAEREALKEEAEARRRAAQAAREQAEADAIRAKVQAQAVSNQIDSLRGEDKIRAQSAQRLMELTEQEARLLELREMGRDVTSGLTAVELARVTEVERLERELADFRQQQFEAHEKAVRRSQQLEQKAAEEAQQARLQRAVNFTQGIQTTVGAFSTFIDAVASSEDNQSRQSFERMKALRRGMAFVSTAAAVTSALANPPGPPYSIPQALAAAATGAAQIAAIESTTYSGSGSLPNIGATGGADNSFRSATPSQAAASAARDLIGGQAHMGSASPNTRLAPDETLVRARHNEEVVTRSDARRMGGETSINIDLKLGARTLQRITTRANSKGRAKAQDRGAPRVGHRDRS